MDHEEDDPGTTWNERARNAHPERMSPRMAWRAIQAALPRDAIISSDIGNNCAIGNAYPTFEEGRKYLSPGLFGPCGRSEEHTSELQSLMRISYAVFCLKKKTKTKQYIVATDQTHIHKHK